MSVTNANVYSPQSDMETPEASSIQSSNFKQDYADLILDKIDEDNQFLYHIRFADEASFHVSMVVTRHNVQI